ncbi:roadblock/LC7 domain-containing protein [Actinomadura algeriensis]|uniref:Regulator of Ras-like GTPase activity (Roadblock/LC7/MglB family) n=1 Tax=Actinomadura algeriensis TaxID=1679523 RepID=A0ABR9JQ58_9ACTN|nr:roadblock/LC7 domain-containing protein [Actinomadura algeriensis]MBE1532692.1 putative regulator of Ras-like GTPase activity (Roadblock/LC7/MglB family) [Actinomadura algeriensis]
MTGAGVLEAEVQAELLGLRKVPGLTGSLVASVDGLLIACDLPPAIEPSSMAAVTASQLGLANRVVDTAHGGGFHEVVVRGAGYVVTYAAGPAASLTVLAEGDVNVGRLHLEARPVARAVAALLAATRK